MRIISICPSNTEALYYLGLEEHIVGVDNYSDWPNSINRLPRLGPDLNIDLDKVQALNPDLVVASLSVPGMEKNIEGLKQRDIPYIISNPNSLEEIGEDLLYIGEATDMTKKARDIYEQYRHFLEYYRELSEQVEHRPTLYWEWWPKPIFTPGKPNWLTHISELGGAKNLFIDHNEASVRTDWEDVYTRNPDHICLVWVGVPKEKIRPKLVKERPGWSELPALQNNRLHVLDEPLFCRPSPRLLTGLQKISYLLHPHIFPAYKEQEDAFMEWMKGAD